MRFRNDTTRETKFHQYEAVRVFTKFGPAVDQIDRDARLTAKLKKKLKQTKTSVEHFGKIVLIEVPFDTNAANEIRLTEAIREAALRSRTALAVVLAHRNSLQIPLQTIVYQEERAATTGPLHRSMLLKTRDAT